VALSAFDLFSIGIGPSSSHTVGPMRAARAFVDELAAGGSLADARRITCSLYGSLGATGLGHGPPDRLEQAGAAQQTVHEPVVAGTAHRSHERRIVLRHVEDDASPPLDSSGGNG
jgi:hypothetical protein